MSEPDMEPIIGEIRRLNEAFPKGLIAIGGVAVYLHVVHDGRGNSAETTHDIDVYLSKEHLGALRDRDELPTLHKLQLIRNGIEINVYLEHRHRLAIPYADIERYSTILDGVRIASREHLLALKTDATIDRFGSGKGTKDARDLVNLVASLDNPRSELLRTTMNPERRAFLRNLAKRIEPFQSMGDGTAHQADNLRATFTANLARIETALGHSPQPIARRRLRARRPTMIPPNFDILPARVSTSPFLASTTTLPELCSIAGIPYQYVEGALPSVGLSRGSGNLRAVDANDQRVLVVDLEQISATSIREEALRIIEVLAHAFHEYAARECARGLFGFPENSPSNDAPTTPTPAQRKAKQRARAAREGLCKVCLAAPARPNRTTCSSCAAKHSLNQGKRRGSKRFIYTAPTKYPQ